jgi:hypothetical protein
MPGGPRSTPSGVRPYSGGRSEPRRAPAGVHVRKPGIPPVFESRPGGTAYAAHAVFQCAQNANPASSPPADSRCCPKTGGEGYRVRLDTRRRRTAAVAAGLSVRFRPSAADSSAGPKLPGFRSAKPHVMKTCLNPKDSGLFQELIPELDATGLTSKLTGPAAPRG